jgi:hypothetical protein
MGVSSLNRKLSFQGFGLVDEHDGDIILDFVNQAALVADETVALLVETNVPLAFGAGQDFQEFFADGHGSSKFGYLIPMLFTKAWGSIFVVGAGFPRPIKSRFQTRAGRPRPYRMLQ